MKWVKGGLIFCAEGQSESMIMGGRAPVALHLDGNRFKIFFAAYDITKRGRIFSLEFHSGRFCRLCTAAAERRARRRGEFVSLFPFFFVFSFFALKK